MGTLDRRRGSAIGHRSSGTAALALDLGTTTLAGRLLDSKGAVLAESQAPNPQGEVGADVIRRLEAALEGEGARLQALLAEGINALVAELLRLAGLSSSSVGSAAAAANPAVSYLLRRLPLREILFPPHRPATRDGASLNAADLGLQLSSPLYLFPLVSGYVGGDLVAFLYSQLPAPASTLFLDIGTNGEMALWTGERWWVTSVPAGPAFEGGGVSSGLSARAGAIEDVRIEGDRLRLGVIGDVPPRGICGSGVAAAVAAAREGGLIDEYGTLRDPGEVPTNLARHLLVTPAGGALRLYRDAAVDILLTQEDIRNFQLAKGAIRAGVECLLGRAASGLPRQTVVTGAFGLSLPARTLKTVAILPPNMIDRVGFIPGGVLEGLCRFLRAPSGVAEVEALALSLRPLPLSGTPAFEKAFIAGMNF